MALSKEYSRISFTAPDTWETVKIGALQRIADATEIMAKNHNQLIDERDRYKRYYEEKNKHCQHLYHKISGLKGAINRMKNKNGGGSDR